MPSVSQTSDIIYTKVKKELGLKETKDTLLITPCHLESIKEDFFFKVYYVKTKPTFVKGTTYLIVIDNNIYLRNKKNSRLKGKVYQKTILPFLKGHLNADDIKKVDKLFVLHQYPGKF